LIEKVLGRDDRPGLMNEDFTRGEERVLLWRMRRLWWSRLVPYRTYPLIPFRKVVYWHLFGVEVTLPRPWAKDLMAGVGDLAGGAEMEISDQVKRALEEEE
jgi:hypothetical protein